MSPAKEKEATSTKVKKTAPKKSATTKSVPKTAKVGKPVTADVQVLEKKEAKKAVGTKAPAKKEESQAKVKTESSGKKLVVKQIGSPIGRQTYQQATLIGLGLNKLHREKTLEDTPAIRGMIEKVKHLIEIQEVK